MSILDMTIIIVVGVVALVWLDILINKLRQKKRARQWKDKQKRMGW